MAKKIFPWLRCANYAAPIVIGLLIAFTIIIVLTIWRINGPDVVKSDQIVCKGIFPYFELIFIVMFSLAFFWAIRLYFKQRHLDDLLATNGQQEHVTFGSLAENHRNWAQVWFSISISIFFGGLIYAIFHIGEGLCVLTPDDGSTRGNWEQELLKIARTLLPNIFIYSFFCCMALVFNPLPCTLAQFYKTFR